MTKVAILDPRHIAPSIPPDSFCLRSFHQLQSDANTCTNKSIHVVQTLEEADIILAPADQSGYGYRFARLTNSTVYRTFCDKIIVYSAEDLFHLPVPGLYPACTPWLDRNGWALPAHYRLDHLPRWNFTREQLDTHRDLLFSFVGSVCNHPIRAKIMALSSSDGFVHDSSPGNQQWWTRSMESQQAIKDHFRSQLLRSKFVLCPRGVIPASIRLFEAMEAAAVPVIIADHLCLPHGPEWSQFTLQIPEKDINRLPSILRDHAPEAHRMGSLARKAWEDYFSPESSLSTTVHWALTLRESIATGYPWHVQKWARIGSFFNQRTLRMELRSLRHLTKSPG